MLADAKGIDADVLGEYRLRDDVTKGVGLGMQAAVCVGGDVAEGVEAELERVQHRRKDPGKYLLLCQVRAGGGALCPRAHDSTDGQDIRRNRRGRTFAGSPTAMLLARKGHGRFRAEKS